MTEEEIKRAADNFVVGYRHKTAPWNGFYNGAIWYRDHSQTVINLQIEIARLKEQLQNKSEKEYRRGFSQALERAIQGDSKAELKKMYAFNQAMLKELDEKDNV